MKYLRALKIVAIRLLDILALMLVFSSLGLGQTTLYTENFGTNSGAWPTGWTTDGLANTWTNPTPGSTPSTGYAGASGGNCPSNGSGGIRTMTFGNNLSTIGFSNITVLWGARKSSSTSSNITCEWSINGTQWTTLSFTDVTNNGTWALVNGGTRINLAGAAGVANLRFRWTFNSNSAFVYRMDDFTVQGTVSCTPPAAPGVTSPVTYCLNAAAIPLTALGTSLLWYTTSTGGTGTTTAPTPVTTSAGTTSYYVSQTISCESPRTRIDVIVTSNPLPIATITSQTNLTCYGVNTGEITIRASGGTPPYTFSINNGSTYPGSGNSSYQFSNLPAGNNYKIRVKDNNGCESSIIP